MLMVGACGVVPLSRRTDVSIAPVAPWMYTAPPSFFSITEFFTVAFPSAPPAGSTQSARPEMVLPS